MVCINKLHNHCGKMIWKCQLSVGTQVSFLSLYPIISFLSVLLSCFVLCCIKRKCTTHKMRGRDTSSSKCAQEYQQPLARARALGSQPVCDVVGRKLCLCVDLQGFEVSLADILEAQLRSACGTSSLRQLFVKEFLWHSVIVHSDNLTKPAHSSLP